MTRYQVICGDMLTVLRTVPAASVDAIVTDPPYGLEFMGKQWDGQVPGPDYWREALRVAKPGAHLLAFGGTRTAHRLACAIEDAGWEIRDCLSWLYGSGFPKSHDVSKAIDREAGAERGVVGPGKYANRGRSIAPNVPIITSASDTDVITAPATPAAQQWQGWGTALKPAWEPIYLARKPLVGTVASNVLEHGCGGINVDGCRIDVHDNEPNKRRSTGGYCPTTSTAVVPNAPYNTHRSATLTEGRWPANLCLDESAAAMLDEQTQDKIHGAGMARAGSSKPRPKEYEESSYNVPCSTGEMHRFGDSGGASRFFYVAKASRAEREAGLNSNGARANSHPTVKPIALMRWLVRLITPPGGIVLDPFAGSGSTGAAAIHEGFRFLGIELSPDFTEISERRIANAQLEAA